MSEKILAGIKVLEYAHLVSGPYCAKLLAGLGAEVVKIEEPGLGDQARRGGPFPNDVPHQERSGLFLYLNINKLGITLNLRTDTGSRIFRRLISEADIFIESNPPKVTRELSLSYEWLRQINPRLIMTSITPFGQTGPYSDFKAYYLNTFHAGGEGYLLPGGLGWLLHPDREPIRAGGFVGEYDSGLSAAIATLGALYGREVTGTGEYIDVSQQEALLGLLRQEIGRYNTGWVESRATRSFPVGGLIQCKDGFVLIMPFEKHMWEGLIEMMGKPDWSTEARFQFSRIAAPVDPRDHPSQADREFANSAIEEWCLKRTKEEIYHLAQEKGCAVAMVCTPEDIANSRQLETRDFFVMVDHPDTGLIKYPGAPAKFSKTPLIFERPSPRLGEHNEAVYCRRLGYTKSELVRMRQGGII